MRTTCLGAMKTKKTTVALTENQLADVLSCLSFAIDQAAAYGHCTKQEQALLEHNRIRLESKLQAALANFPSVHTRP